MKTIGILLTSPAEVGGIYQYSISIIDALKFLEKKKYFKIHYFYTNIIWENLIPKRAKKIYIKNSTHIRIIKKILHLFINIFNIENKYLFFKNILYGEVKALNSSACDLIIFPSQNITSYQIKKKKLTAIHDLMFKFYPNLSEFPKKIKYERDIHYRNILNNSTGILVDSLIGKQHIKKIYNHKFKNIFILPFVVPKYLSNRKKYNIKKYFSINNDYIFYPAQFWEHKNHMRLIKAFEKIIMKKKDILLVLCGSKKYYFKKIEKYILQKNLFNKILYLGRVDDKQMYSLYKHAKLVVYPSLFGPTNIPPLEALYCNTPVVCSDIFGMKQQLKNASLYFNPFDINDIYKKIFYALNNSNVRQNLIRNGKKIIKENNQNKFNKLLKKHINKTLNS